MKKRIEDLALTFPSLKGKPGVRPWDANTVDDWTSGEEASHGERITGRFILAVYNPNFAWRSGRFDLMEALAVWDEAHYRAFLAWVVEPWCA
jgi:hypothetical protein